jgi:hypothetical protein
VLFDPVGVRPGEADSIQVGGHFVDAWGHDNSSAPFGAVFIANIANIANIAKIANIHGIRGSFGLKPAAPLTPFVAASGRLSLEQPENATG